MQQFSHVHYNLFKKKESIAVKFTSPESRYISPESSTYYFCFDWLFVFAPIKKKEKISN